MKFIELTFRNEEKTFVNADLINYFTLAGGLYKASNNIKECVMKGGISLCGVRENE